MTRNYAAIASMLKYELNAIAVPPYDGAAIRRRSVEPAPSRQEKHRIWPLAAALLLVPALALGLTQRDAIIATVRTDLVKLGFTQGPVTFEWNTEITSLSQAAREAPFHFVAPRGLPIGTKLVWIGSSGRSFSLSYRLPNGRGLNVQLSAYHPHEYYQREAAVILFTNNGKLVRSERIREHRWIVGNEVMIVYSPTLTEAQLDIIRRATHGIPAPTSRSGR